MLKDQWQREDMAETNLTKQRFMLDRQRNNDLINHNEGERVLRKEAEQAAKNRDKDMLAVALTRE